MNSATKEGEVQIEIKDLNKTYRRDEKETVAIKDISISINKGELVSIVGPSGCGKTTILRMIAGLLEPTSGSIEIKGSHPGSGEGIEVGSESNTAAIKFKNESQSTGGGMSSIHGPGPDRAMVFQDFALFPWRSVRKNVEFGMEIAGVPKEERRERAERYIKMVGLENFIDSRVYELSGGMKQRVGIARAFVNHPEVTLMDEPFGALDAQTRNIMQTQLTHILEKTSQTIIFVTHSVDEAIYLSDRIVILTKRPATIKEIVNIEWPRPRDRASPEFTALRKRILEELEKENVME